MSVRIEAGALSRLAAPIALTQLAQVAVSTTNLALMGTLGVDEVAAGGLALVLFNQIRTMCVGLITGSGNQVASVVSDAERRGVRADEDVRGVVRAAFVIATFAALIGGAVLIGLGWLLPWLGQDAAVFDAARPMMIALAPGLLPCLWFQVLRQYSVGMRKPQALLLVTLGSVALNLVLALAFIQGWLGLPACGLTGIGIATSLVFAVTCAVLWAMVHHDPLLGRTLPTTPWPLTRKTLIDEVRLGTPIALTYGSEAGMFSVLALVMGSFGPAALAAHNVVYQVIYIVFQLAIGLSHGASILVSRHVARRDFTEARVVAWLALAFAGAITLVTGVLYWAAPGFVLAPFLNPTDSSTENIAYTLLKIGIVLQFFDAAQNIGTGLLRGLKRTTTGLRLSLVGYWAVGLPAALLFAFPLNLGPAGVWWGLTLGLAATALLMLRKYFALIDNAAALSTPESVAAGT
ncbi:MATE family efflux transporter [Nocardia camponoti]|uniref:Probable multidrug resistance protein NorM n=1 Tax=Nocardia camponoti TaxID=1616106 RepID=A0A917QH46_9NOCA|nr:MATE family efflux transporter [Nocardia camponoti]GGK48788.1 putative multidrug resistance protein NorM [Nocardia camponoti]